ncbi:hypothetical protein WV31_08270 [Magnetospirillum sp. ME-1]|nr:hypothetical protein WV31_08270 [Magnetospirillum sp. ME-1]
MPSKRHLRNATKLLLEVHALSKVSRQELCDHLGIQPTNLSNWNSFVECKIDGGAPSVETARRLLDFCAPYLLAKNSVLLTDVLKDAILISMILDRDDTPTEQILRGLTYNVDRELNKFRKLIVRHSAKLPNRLKKRYGPVGFQEHFTDRKNVHVGNWAEYYKPDDIERQMIIESYGYKFLRINRFNLGADPAQTLSRRLS